MGLLSQRFGLTRYEADEYYTQALDAYDKDNPDEALTQIAYAITLLPQNAEYHAARGLFCIKNNQPDDARASFEEALRLHSAEVVANYGMGMLAFGAKQWEEARQWFNKARAVNPTQVEIPYYIALTYHRQQDNKTAKAYMQQAHELMDNAGDKRRTDAKRWLREFDELIEEAEQAREEAPTQPELPIKGAAGELSTGDDDA